MFQVLTSLISQAYDYAGSWLAFADNQANLYGGARTNVSTDAAVKWFTSHGAAASKINMGMPPLSSDYALRSSLLFRYASLWPCL